MKRIREILGMKKPKTDVCECPLCQGKGIVKYFKPKLKGIVIKNVTVVDDCPLCFAFGVIEVKV